MIRLITAILLVTLSYEMTAQPVYRKGPTRPTLGNDSLFTNDFYYTSPGEGSKLTSLTSSYAAINIDRRRPVTEPVGMVQGAVVWGHQKKNFRAEAYLAGGIGKYQSFFTAYAENYRTFPGFTNGGRFKDSLYYNVMPGFIAEYQPGQHFTFTAGYDKNFIGQGYRSMLLSDNAANYPFIRINAKFWKVSYTTLFAYLSNVNLDGVNRLQSNKYTALHLLEFKPWHWLDIQLYESVLWQARDSSYNRGFDVNYLNPVIFYRPVEFSIGSSDNALVGGAINIRPFKNITLYSQVLLDEFLLREIKAGNGWWANKFAIQAGIKAFDLAGVKGLTALAEANLARPYTYAHSTPNTNYGHNGQALAHPLGANFYEALFMLQYKKDQLSLSLLFAGNKKGYDNSLNFGGNIFSDYQSRSSDYGNAIGQGNSVQLSILQASAGYTVSKKLNLEAFTQAAFRQSEREKNLLLAIGLRTPFFNIYSDY